MTFDFLAFRFVFAARQEIQFPEGTAGNVFRGAFGSALRKIACTPECQGARDCPARESCAYARIFEPVRVEMRPSGFSDWPRPFVFRVACLDGKTIEPGERFFLNLHLFETRNPPREELQRTFARLGEDGLGPRRGRADLISMEQRPVSIGLDPPCARVRRLRVEFATPTELKGGDGLVPEPEFPVLFARARDRVSTLRALYGPGPLELDFRGMGERAKMVRMSRCELRRVKTRRRSSRTGQVHGIGGFVGVAEYEGELAEFVPLLEAACWTGVGRQCSWGKGELRIERTDKEAGGF